MTTATIDLPDTTESFTDDQLMARFNAGDAESNFGELMRRYHTRIHRLVKSIVRDKHLAEDVTQDVFTKLLLNSRLYEPGSCFIAWLSGIARNLSLSALRSQKRISRPMTELHIDPEWDGAVSNLHGETGDQKVEERELRSKFEEAVSRLPRRYQTVFRACVMNGRTYQRVAGELRVPVGTVAIRIRRARQRLYAELSRHIGPHRRPPCVQ